jgi:hypothetical protein
MDDQLKPRISRWLHDQCRSGTIPEITTAELEFLRNLKPLPFEERANRMLMFIADETKDFGKPIHLFARDEIHSVGESFEDGISDSS